jgi:beta-hydroxylase
MRARGANGGGMVKWSLLALFLAAVVFVQMRGKVRHKWFKQIFDHSALLAPLNALMYLLSRVPTTPYVAVDRFAGLALLEAHWEEIRDEAQALAELRRIKAAENNDDVGFNSFFKEGWKRFYLKWYDEKPPSAERYCPRTVALLQQVPSVKAALFAELPRDAKLNAHRDPYAGSMRYHLGLATPNDDRCRIWVDGEVYSWRDGQAVVFDETYIHWVRNDTDQDRLILLCDIERPLRYRWAQWLNRGFGRYVMSAAASPNDAGDRTGVIGKLFRISFVAGQYRRRFKRWSPQGYRWGRVLLIAGVVALFVWW